MTYKDIVKLLFLPGNESLVPDGIAYSEAMCEMVDGRLWDSFFLYTITDTRNKAIGPIAKISVDASTKTIVDYCEYENPKEFSLESNYDDETIIEALNSYESLYPELRKVYSNKQCDAEAKALLLQIIGNINVFANDDMLCIYNQLFSETFKFMIDNSK